MGRPRKYTKRYCKRIIDYFSKPPYFEKLITIKDKNGRETTKTERWAGDLPTIEGFCAQVNIAKKTLHEWVKKYPEFGNAYNRCKALQYNFMVTNGLHGLYKGYFAGLTAKNILGWKDKVDHSNEDGSFTPRCFVIPPNGKEGPEESDE